VSGALPTFVVIGAMKCGTTALHRMLGGHPGIAMSDPKELNFFLGGAQPADAGPWEAGNWWRGLDWYAGHFPAHVPVRGESSPGYTSPDHPEVAARLADTLPAARLVYLVRDPIDRAVSQYEHHRRDGAESRPVMEAPLDPDSQYLARSRFHERLTPFLDHVPRERILVIAMEDLRHERDATLSRILSFLGADARRTGHAGQSVARRWTRPPLAVRERFAAVVRDDVTRLRRFTGHRFARWSV
jgi:hypothetical protein